MFDEQLQRLAQEVGDLLIAKQQILTFAESCTGGLASALMTHLAGSSAYFDSGLVVYSNQAKQDLLKVKASSLAKYGAVSEQVAAEMAMGALQQGRATLAVSVTGIAGPDGGTAEKPVGTVCFAWASKPATVKTETQHFAGSRAEIRMQSVKTMLSGLKDCLK